MNEHPWLLTQIGTIVQVDVSILHIALSHLVGIMVNVSNAFGTVTALEPGDATYPGVTLVAHAEWIHKSFTH
jgi:hypothetical protein